MTGKKTSTDGSWIESQLLRTQATIERLTKKHPPQGADLLESGATTTEGTVATNNHRKGGVHRLSELRSSLEFLELSVEFSSWEEEWKQKQPFISLLDNIHAILEDCAKLTSLLLRFPPQTEISPSFEMLYQIVWKRYMHILNSTRGALSTQIQFFLRATGFPKSSSSDALNRCFLEGNDEVEMSELSLVSCCTQLVALQTIHEHFLVASSTQAPWQRLDLVVEFCRPIVIRARYHFTSSADHSLFQKNEEETRVDLSSRYDRLVEWLISFIRETIKTPLELIQTYFDDIARNGWKEAMDIIISYSGNVSCQLPPPAKVFQHFLREMVLLVRHILLDDDTSRSQKRKTSSALCTIVSDDVLFSTCMEQFLRFDEYVQTESSSKKSTVKTKSVRNSHDIMVLQNESFVPIPRLIGLITPYRDRLDRWVELEHDTAMYLLSSVPLPDIGRHYLHKTPSDINFKTAFPTFVETLVSLLNSAQEKCKVAFSPFGKFEDKYPVMFEWHPTSFYDLAKYLNRVQMPLVVSFLDATTAWTKQQVRHIVSCVQRLLRPTPSAKLSWSVSVNSTIPNSDQVATKEIITGLLQDYCSMTAGASCISSFLSTQALYWESVEMLDDLSCDFVNAQEVSASNILKRMNDSVSRLSEAMLDELASSIAESMVVDDASVASYLMKIHYILEEESDGSEVNVLARGVTTPSKTSPTDSLDRAFPLKSKFPFLDISPDLVDFLSTLHDLVNTFNDFACVSSSEVVIAADKLQSNLADNLSLKLIEVLLDVPEINSAKGEVQVSIDMQAIAEIFYLPSRLQFSDLKYFGSFNRLLDIVKLMTLEYISFISLRAAFSGLAGCQHDSSTDYAAVDMILENVTSDEKVVKQAQDMLRVKGFDALDLRDALIVLYKMDKTVGR